MTFLLSFALLGLSGFSFYKADEMELVLFQKIPINLEIAGWVLGALGVVVLLAALEDEGIDLWDIGSQIITFPFYLIMGVVSFAIEYWWVVLIGAVLLWPKISDHFEIGDIFESRKIIAQQEQTAPVDETQPLIPDSTRMLYDRGVCRTLKEDACAVILFVNDGVNSWTEQEARNYLDHVMIPGLEYVHNKAASYGVSIAVKYGYYTDEQNHIETICYPGVITIGNEGLHQSDLLTQCAQAMGYESEKEMLEADRAYYGCDQIAYMICLDMEGRGYAYWSLGSNEVEYAVMFSTWERGATLAASAAHEFLHLFGAEDMYAEGDMHVNRNKLALQLHRYEIMREYCWNVEYNILSPYTAYAVGWRDTLPPEYDCPEWWS